MIDRRGPIPDVMRTVVLDEPWDLVRLWSLWLPTESYDVAGLAWQLELPWWPDRDRVFAVSPLEVLADPGAHPEQWRRTLEADLRSPIYAYRAERLVVLDGMHRLLKAHHFRWVRISVRTVSDDARARLTSGDRVALRASS